MQISILQWNVWYKEPIQHIAEFLKEHTVDIICLQELSINGANQDVPNTVIFIAKQLGYNYHAKELPIKAADGSAMTLANAIFTRFPITQKRGVFINKPQAGGGYDDEYRSYVECVLDVDGKNLTIGTTHMSYTDTFNSTPNKRAETDRLVTELGKHSERFVFTGDLNAPPRSYTIEKVSSLLKNAAPDLTQKTWTTKPFSYRGFTETDLNWRLDHVFATSDIEFISSEILKTNFSDHLPIRSVLKF